MATFPWHGKMRPCQQPGQVQSQGHMCELHKRPEIVSVVGREGSLACGTEHKLEQGTNEAVGEAKRSEERLIGDLGKNIYVAAGCRA